MENNRQYCLQKEPQKTMWQSYVDRDYRFYVDTLPPEPIIDMLPKPMQAAHYLWTWIWFLSIPGCLALGFIHWALMLSILIIPGTIRSSVKKSAQQFVIQYAYEDERFFNVCWKNKIIQKVNE